MKQSPKSKFQGAGSQSRNLLFTEIGPFPISSSQCRGADMWDWKLASLKDGWWACTQGMLPTLAANGTISDFTRPPTVPFPLQWPAQSWGSHGAIPRMWLMMSPHHPAASALGYSMSVRAESGVALLLRQLPVGATLQLEEHSFADDAFHFLVPRASRLLHRGDTARDHLPKFPGHCTPLTQDPLSRTGFGD